ncbi:hypothetical protein RND81_14G183200 [Saponaria officinalis]|uniref:CTLH domain-containing protein n=1 Tax=Saponaria officinalis TaxID=3572 RepID=A0AAW1GS30_SAPOF
MLCSESDITKDLVFMILQFLDEHNFKDTLHKLEYESGFFFNMNYFEDEVHNGNWDKVERYLSGFTKVDDNWHSMKMFFKIRKQKYLEALDKYDRGKAVVVLKKELKVFTSLNEELFREFTHLLTILTLDNFREDEQLSNYGDTQSARAIVFSELKKLIEVNPVFHGKLQFPNMNDSRLQTVVTQSQGWQHLIAAQVQRLKSLPNLKEFPPLNSHVPFQATPTQVSHQQIMLHRRTVIHPGMNGPSIPAGLMHPKTPSSSNPPMDYPSRDSDQVAKGPKPFRIGLEVKFPPHGHGQPLNFLDDLPKTVVRTLNQGSSPMSMDFHPDELTLLLVGTNVGDIALWEVGSREMLVLRNFEVWNLSTCSRLQETLAKDPVVSVNRVLWSPDGSLFGIAYSRHIVQIYSYDDDEDIQQHLEIDAHVGAVNDIAFSTPNNQLSLITCGDDKTIKVWDAGNGTKQYTFEGHKAPVLSVCAHYNQCIQFIFSMDVDGKIKKWLYDNLGSRVDNDAPGRSCTTMAYSQDGTRLFSCGTSKDGKTYLVEWSECEGAPKRKYLGFHKKSLGVVQFDTTKNRYLAAGDNFSIKFWDMDSVQLLTSADADGGLPACPRIRFNKDGTLLAVSTNENGIKILSNSAGLRLLQTYENPFNDSSRASEALTKLLISNPTAVCDSTNSGIQGIPTVSTAGINGDSRCPGDVKSQTFDFNDDKSNIWTLTEINKPSECQSSRLAEHIRAAKIARLTYNNSGNTIIALASNAVHFLWKWQRTERNPSWEATANVSPQLWQPSSGILLINDVTDATSEDAVPCFALSKNDSYIISASGGKISLFNLMTFMTMKDFMPPPPAATFIAFYPKDHNVIAVGMDDSTIQIYNVRLDEVTSELKGHSRRITGLTFSEFLNVMVSSDADAQICVWSLDVWEKRRSKFLLLPQRTSTASSDMCVQFHKNQIHFLVVHESQLAIYEAEQLDCMKQWVPREYSAPISDATFSCDSQLVFASFLDATVCVFDAANLGLRCRIYPSAYLPATVSSYVHPVVIAAHPKEMNQFAVGLSDGGVHVFEPLESEGRWGLPPPWENGFTRQTFSQDLMSRLTTKMMKPTESPFSTRTCLI